MPIRIAIVGAGRVATQQHLPALRRSENYSLVACASLAGSLPGVPTYSSVEELLTRGPAFEALAMCQPPQARFAAARTALQAGKHVLLEKPPCATLGEVEALRQLAQSQGLSLFSAWHSRCAPGVEAARHWLADRRVIRGSIIWKEDVRQWHPGQEWIWQPGGLGVFDAGINALSIASYILPGELIVSAGVLEVPEGRATPIAARLHLSAQGDVPVAVLLDWRQPGEPTWTIQIDTEDGCLALAAGGSRLSIDGQPREVGPEREYDGLYARFAQLVDTGSIELDSAPLRIVADAYMRCEWVTVEAFQDP